jgi:hypothetical protein
VAYWKIAAQGVLSIREPFCFTHVFGCPIQDFLSNIWQNESYQRLESMENKFVDQMQLRIYVADSVY